MENQNFWATEKYNRFRQRMLDNPEQYHLAPHIVERCKEGIPITREEWETTFERLNTYARYVLLPLIGTDVLLENADYIIKNCQVPHFKDVPATYDDAAILELVPILMERLRNTTQVASDLAEVCVKPKPESKVAPLPYKLTRVAVAAIEGDGVAENRFLGHIATWAVTVGGCKELTWLSPLAFEVMATTPQQFNLGFFARMLPLPSNTNLKSSPLVLVFDEGEVDPHDTLVRVAPAEWQLPILRNYALQLGFEYVQFLDSGFHLYCHGPEEKQAELLGYLPWSKEWHGRDVHVTSRTRWKDLSLEFIRETLHTSMVQAVRRRRRWPEDLCLCADIVEAAPDGTIDCPVCCGTGLWPHS